MKYVTFIEAKLSEFGEVNRSEDIRFDIELNTQI